MKLFSLPAILITFENKETLRCSIKTGFDTLDGHKRGWELKAGDRFSKTHGVIKSVGKDGKIEIWK